MDAEPTGPEPDAILVHYMGRLSEHDDGWMKYEGGKRAFIYLHDRNARFDYTDLCRAVMGRLAQPTAHALLCMGTVMEEWPDHYDSIVIRPIQSSADVVELLDKHLAVYYQEDLVEHTVEGGNMVESYRIPKDIYALWKNPCPAAFESMWKTAQNREREELAAYNAGVPRPWYVSHSESYRPYNLCILNHGDRGCEEIQFKHPL